MRPRLFLAKRRLWRWVYVVALASVTAGTYSAYSAYRDVKQSLGDIHYINSHIGDVKSPAGQSSLRSHLLDAQRTANRAKNTLVLWSGDHLIGWIPGFGTDARDVNMLLGQVSTLAQQGQRLVSAYAEFSQSVHSSGRSISSAYNNLYKTLAASDAIFRRIQPLPPGFLNPFWSSESEAMTKIARAHALLNDAQSAMNVAGEILGISGPKNILVLPENNAEMRDQGGVFSYSLLRASNGHLVSIVSGHSYDLNVSTPVPYPISPGARQYYLVDQPNSDMRSINVSADFPTTARTAAEIFTAHTGIAVNDVVALDVPAMAALLGVGGPLQVPAVGKTLTVSNFATVILHDLYSQYAVGSQGPRYDALSQVSDAILHRVEHAKGSLLSYLKALSSAIPGRHLLLWSAHGATEKSIQALGADGRIDSVDPLGTFHVAVESAVADKMDYYIHAHETYDVNILPSGEADISSSVTLVNTAPKGQSASYQLGPDHINSFVPGEYVSNIYQWSPLGSNAIGGYADAGLILSATTTSVLPGQRSTVNFFASTTRAITNGVLNLHFVPQSTLNPVDLTVTITKGAATLRSIHQLFVNPLTIAMKVN